MAQLSDGFGCCGIREIEGIGELSAKEVMADLAEDFRYDHKWRHAVFTQAGKKARYGLSFAAFIKKHKLGTVVASPTKENPNSGNPLKAFVWTVNWPALRKYLKDNLGEDEYWDEPRHQPYYGGW